MLDALMSAMRATTDSHAQELLAKALRRIVEVETQAAIDANTPAGCLTHSEVVLGQASGKIACIKAYRQRTGLDLGNAKRDVEDHFMRFGLAFKDFSR